MVQVVKPVGVHTRHKIALNVQVFADNVVIQTTDEINVRNYKMTVMWVMMVNVHIVKIITVVWVRIVQKLLETEMMRGRMTGTKRGGLL